MTNEIIQARIKTQEAIRDSLYARYREVQEEINVLTQMLYDNKRAYLTNERQLDTRIDGRCIRY